MLLVWIGFTICSKPTPSSSFCLLSGIRLMRDNSFITLFIKLELNLRLNINVFQTFVYSKFIIRIDAQSNYVFQLWLACWEYDYMRNSNLWIIINNKFHCNCVLNLKLWIKTKSSEQPEIGAESQTKVLWTSFLGRRTLSQYSTSGEVNAPRFA